MSAPRLTRSFTASHTLMVQGTTSDAGKSVLVAALCRILARHGIAVAPFKPQNMALNSAVTEEGGEIGRAQAVQAEACYLKPSVDMNPILLKPNTDVGAQIIVNGQSIGNMNAVEYHQRKPELLQYVLAAHKRLQNRYQVVVVEGAGSPAEINLREHDIANMGFAEAADCPVIIIADIDRGGVFAHLVGTYDLLSESERRRVAGFVINRFRGDISLLQPGIEWLEQRCGVPVLAVLPYIHNLHIEAEDAIDQQQLLAGDQSRQRLRVVVVAYPRMSNHTDFDVLRMHPQIDCQFIRDPQQYQGADLLILPGSKNVRGDLQWLVDEGWRELIQRHLRLGGKLLGVCGGYQMLGRQVHDPDGIESAPGSSVGFGFLDMETTLTKNKILRNVMGHVCQSRLASVETVVKGYEIHAGISSGMALARPLFMLTHTDSNDSFPDGSMSVDGSVIGSYVHGLLDQPAFLQQLLFWAGLSAEQQFDYPAFREQQIDRLANEVEAVIPLTILKKLLSL